MDPVWFLPSVALALGAVAALWRMRAVRDEIDATRTSIRDLAALARAGTDLAETTEAIAANRSRVDDSLRAPRLGPGREPDGLDR